MHTVAPRVGAWIETPSQQTIHCSATSHPVWVRGLKQVKNGTSVIENRVAPRVGAWIETIRYHVKDIALKEVAPRVGAWIETIPNPYYPYLPTQSHPVWVRGLKRGYELQPSREGTVAPRVGAWIETS